MEILVISSLILMCEFKIISAGIEKKVSEYFESDTYKIIQTLWQTERKSYENAIALILEQNYGYRGVNVYVRKLLDSRKISDGFYFSDKVVDVLLLPMHLQDLPNLIAPDVTFALASNFLRVEAKLSKIIINTNYLLLRNQSALVLTAPGQNSTQMSPFSFQQVQDSGELTIVADDCYLAGYTITTLSAETINLGLDTFRVTNCKFTIEIYSLGLGSPPVIAPYFSKQQSITLEKMLTKPIQAELLPKLQAAVIAYINTTAIFGDKLSELRSHQSGIFKETANFVNGIVKKFIKNTISDNQGVLKLNAVEVWWNKKCLDGTCRTCVKLMDMMLYGLDTVYSAHTGGPYKLKSTNVAEAIRFSTIQVRGKLYFENTTIKGEHDFTAELRDVAVNIEMEAEEDSFALVPSKLDFIGWRAIEFSILDLGLFAHERKASQSFITGYLINELPKRLIDQLSNSFGGEKYRKLYYSIDNNP